MTGTLKRTIKRFFVPSLQNELRPYSLRASTLATIVVMLILVEISLFAYISAVYRSKPDSSFVGAVSGALSANVAKILPGVLIQETNNYRSENSINPLKENMLLTQAAQSKANDMANKGYFSHVDPNGQLPWAWFDRVGYSYEYAGENLAVNFVDAEDVTNAWINSPAHRANLVNSNFTDIGIGVAKGVLKGNESLFVVQFFGAPAIFGMRFAAQSTAAVANSAFVLVSPREAVDITMNIFIIMILFLIAIPLAVVIGNHRSPNMGFRFRELLILYKKQMLAVLFLIILIVGFIYLNFKLFRSATLPQASYGSDSTGTVLLQ